MKNYVLIIALLFSLTSVGQEEKPNLSIKKAKGEINLDGVLDEHDWNDAEIAPSCSRALE